MPVPLPLSELDRLAQQCGYPDYPTALYDLYVVQGLGLYELSSRFHIHYRRLRKDLVLHGVTIRSRGGANNVKVIMTPELYKECCAHGVQNISERLGVSTNAVERALRGYLERLGK